LGLAGHTIGWSWKLHGRRRRQHSHGIANLADHSARKLYHVRRGRRNLSHEGICANSFMRFDKSASRDPHHRVSKLRDYFGGQRIERRPDRHRGRALERYRPGLPAQHHALGIRARKCFQPHRHEWQRRHEPLGPRSAIRASVERSLTTFGMTSSTATPGCVHFANPPTGKSACATQTLDSSEGLEQKIELSHSANSK
jgi:hypothetical protein